MLDGSDSIPHVLVGSTMFEARVMDQVGSQDEAEGKGTCASKKYLAGWWFAPGILSFHT